MNIQFSAERDNATEFCESCGFGPSDPIHSKEIALPLNETPLSLLDFDVLLPFFCVESNHIKRRGCEREGGNRLAWILHGRARLDRNKRQSRHRAERYSKARVSRNAQ